MYHFVVLDACFRSDGQPYGRENSEWTDANIPGVEAEWLRADLKQTPHKSVVFVHQRLDVEPPLGVKNASEIRRVLEESGKVLAVLQGHYHQRLPGGGRCPIRDPRRHGGGNRRGEQRLRRDGHPARRCHSDQGFPKAEELPMATSSRNRGEVEGRPPASAEGLRPRYRITSVETFG